MQPPLAKARSAQSSGQKGKMSQLQKFSHNIEKLEQSAVGSDPASPESQNVDRSSAGTSPTEVTVSPTLQQLRKAQKRRDKALKEILTLDNRYCL